MITYYEVRFLLYQYNGGGQIRNGLEKHKEKFKTIEDATKFHNSLQVLKMSGNTSEFASNYIWGGYLDKIDGIYKITEEKL